VSCPVGKQNWPWANGLTWLIPSACGSFFVFADECGKSYGDCHKIVIISTSTDVRSAYWRHAVLKSNKIKAYEAWRTNCRGGHHCLSNAMHSIKQNIISRLKRPSVRPSVCGQDCDIQLVIYGWSSPNLEHSFPVSYRRNYFYAVRDPK